MKLQTQIPIKKQESNCVNYRSKVLLVGSCFVENIGNKLAYYKFKTLQNPLGILFNPEAIVTFLERSLTQTLFTEAEVFFHNEQWHCFEAHSVLSNTSKEALLTQLNEALLQTKVFIMQATHLVLTLGTAWVYEYLKTQQLIANCHKVSQHEFAKKMLLATEIEVVLAKVLVQLKKVNPSLQVIFTVSPVRHLKDGFTENTLSKAQLVTAVHQLVKKHEDVHYFPAYEIMLDELRDYRFYQDDMLHPNTLAVNYIWEKFITAWIFQETQTIMTEVAFIQKGLAHKPFNPTGKAHQKFLSDLQQRQKQLQEKISGVEF